MNDPAIRVENLGKYYQIGSAKDRNKTLREALVGAAKAPFLRVQEAWSKVSAPSSPHAEGISPLSAPRSPLSSHDDFIWALKDVSFEVKRGEVVGIIGRNGAGKSTLLKILARITEPTKGKITLRGRVGSLLEVGTGFHSELTGEENIYLSGTILGMSSREISNKFDEIVAFAEMEKFIHTPVKHYSSGMYMRLAFAVAAHLEPEILLVDEVLAVGDAQFQKRCIGKMGQVGRGGRTVLFISHNMQAIRQLCQRAILLEAGITIVDGKSDAVIQRYLQGITKAESPELLERMIRELPPDPAFRLESIRLFQSGQIVINSVSNGEPLEIEISYQVLERATGFRVFFDLCDSEDTLLFRSFHDEQAEGIPTVEPGRYVSQAVITPNLLAPTNYELRILATVFNVRMCIPYPGICIPLYVERNGKSNRAYMIEPIRGKLAPVFDWTTKCLENL